MQRVLRALKYEADWWKKRAEESVEGTNGGARVFALRQSSLRMAMYDNCAQSWSSVPEWLALGLVSDGDVEMREANSDAS